MDHEQRHGWGSSDVSGLNDRISNPSLINVGTYNDTRRRIAEQLIKQDIRMSAYLFVRSMRNAGFSYTEILGSAVRLSKKHKKTPQGKAIVYLFISSIETALAMKPEKLDRAVEDGMTVGLG
jgi:hypothetical protein